MLIKGATGVKFQYNDTALSVWECLSWMAVYWVVMMLTLSTLQTHLKEEFSLRQMPSSFKIFPFPTLYIDGWARYWPIRNDFTGMKHVPLTETVLCTGNKPGRLKLNKTNTLFKTHPLLDRPPFHRRYSQMPFREWTNVIQKLNEVCS